MRWATPAQWYRSSMPVCWKYNRRDERWRDVNSCTKGLNREATVAAWLLLGFCCALVCKMGWMLVGLAVLGGRVG